MQSDFVKVKKKSFSANDEQADDQARRGGVVCREVCSCKFCCSVHKNDDDGRSGLMTCFARHFSKEKFFADTSSFIYALATLFSGPYRVSHCLIMKWLFIDSEKRHKAIYFL